MFLLKFDHILRPIQTLHNIPVSVSTTSTISGNSICQDGINDRTSLELSPSFLFCK